VLSILLVDIIHLDCDLPISIHCEDASNLPLVVLLTHLGDVPFKHFVVFSKLNDLVQIWWILNLACGLHGAWTSFAVENTGNDKES
jgi:hypothetical protein